MGRQPLCESVLRTAAPRVHRTNGEPLHVLLNAGTFCPYAVIPENAAVRVPPETPLDKAALIGCGVATGVGAALNTAGVKAGESAAIFGTGGVGLNVVQGARLAHAAQIIALDLSDRKLLHARDFGATHTVNPANTDPVNSVLELTAGRGVDHAFDVVGHPAIMEQALQTLAQGGVLTLVGNAARDATFAFHPRALLAKQQSIRGCVYGSCRPPLDFPLFVDWYNSGLLKLDELLSATITLDDLPAEFTNQPEPESIRRVVRF
jgi:S-(hydroxymethyl)glutathione dehydrogenase/alcohol dehydrogenase